MPVNSSRLSLAGLRRVLNSLTSGTHGSCSTRSGNEIGRGSTLQKMAASMWLFMCYLVAFTAPADFGSFLDDVGGSATLWTC